MAELEQRIETATAALIREGKALNKPGLLAGGNAQPRRSKSAQV
jgi:hypothetical protein